MARVATFAIFLTAVAALAPGAQAWVIVCSELNGVVCDAVYEVAYPMLLRGRTTPDGVHLEWSPALGDDGNYTYKVHRRSVETGEEQAFDVGSERSYTDEPPSDGIYVYYITAWKDGEQVQPPSNPYVTGGSSDWLLPWPRCRPASVGPTEINDGCLKPLPGGIQLESGVQLEP